MDTGNPGTNTYYCSTCEDGVTRGKINCTDPVAQLSAQPFGRLPPGALENLQPLAQAPTTPLPTPPTADENVLPGDTGVLQQPRTAPQVAPPYAGEAAQPLTSEEEPGTSLSRGSSLRLGVWSLRAGGARSSRRGASTTLSRRSSAGL